MRTLRNLFLAVAIVGAAACGLDHPTANVRPMDASPQPDAPFAEPSEDGPVLDARDVVDVDVLGPDADVVDAADGDAAEVEAGACGTVGRPCCVVDAGQSPCGPELRCERGSCVERCPPGQVLCGDVCVDLATDAAHCGRCGMTCPARANAMVTCMDRRCVFACMVGFADCDGMADTGCETATGADRANCGACGTACGVTQVCAAGRCVDGCTDMRVDCMGACRDLMVDTAHCGRCGNLCSAGTNAVAACVAGRCQARCATGFADCDGMAATGCEVDTRTSVFHCGACRNSCPSRANAFTACGAGACGFMCMPGFADCDGMAATGCEVDTRASDAHCGACGRACPTGQVCRAGACTPCGVMGAPCCGPTRNTCGSALSCAGGVCRCGETGQACCGGTSCMGGNVCTAGTCAACGGSDQPCCSGRGCNMGLACTGGDAAARCIACGGPGLPPCCGFALPACGAMAGCPAGFTSVTVGPRPYCVEATPGMPAGAPGRPCGPMGSCMGAEYVCAGAGPGARCVHCGALSEACCAGSTCTAARASCRTGQCVP